MLTIEDVAPSSRGEYSHWGENILDKGSHQHSLIIIGSKILGVYVISPTGITPSHSHDLTSHLATLQGHTLGPSTKRLNQ